MMLPQTKLRQGGADAETLVSLADLVRHRSQLVRVLIRAGQKPACRQSIQQHLQVQDPAARHDLTTLEQGNRLGAAGRGSRLGAAGRGGGRFIVWAWFWYLG